MPAPTTARGRLAHAAGTRERGLEAILGNRAVRSPPNKHGADASIGSLDRRNGESLKISVGVSVAGGVDARPVAAALGVEGGEDQARFTARTVEVPLAVHVVGILTTTIMA